MHFLSCHPYPPPTSLAQPPVTSGSPDSVDTWGPHLFWPFNIRRLFSGKFSHGCGFQAGTPTPLCTALCFPLKSPQGSTRVSWCAQGPSGAPAPQAPPISRMHFFCPRACWTPGPKVASPSPDPDSPSGPPFRRQPRSGRRHAGMSSLPACWMLTFVFGALLPALLLFQGTLEPVQGSPTLQPPEQRVVLCPETPSGSCRLVT